jgi:hypothetical protein
MSIFTSSRCGAWLKLAAWWTAIAACWLGLLPYIASRPRVQARIEELEQQGIDPSAMFYSELEAMHGVLQDVDRIHRVAPEVFWSRGEAGRVPQIAEAACGTVTKDPKSADED